MLRPLLQPYSPDPPAAAAVSSTGALASCTQIHRPMQQQQSRPSQSPSSRRPAPHSPPAPAPHPHPTPPAPPAYSAAPLPARYPASRTTLSYSASTSLRHRHRQHLHRSLRRSTSPGSSPSHHPRRTAAASSAGTAPPAAPPPPSPASSSKSSSSTRTAESGTTSVTSRVSLTAPAPPHRHRSARPHRRPHRRRIHDIARLQPRRPRHPHAPAARISTADASSAAQPHALGRLTANRGRVPTSSAKFPFRPRLPAPSMPATLDTPAAAASPNRSSVKNFHSVLDYPFPPRTMPNDDYRRTRQLDSRTT